MSDTGALFSGSTWFSPLAAKGVLILSWSTKERSNPCAWCRDTFSFSYQLKMMFCHWLLRPNESSVFNQVETVHSVVWTSCKNSAVWLFLILSVLVARDIEVSIFLFPNIFGTLKSHCEMKPLLTGWNFALEMRSLLGSPVIFCACIMLQDRLENKTLLILLLANDCWAPSYETAKQDTKSKEIYFRLTLKRTKYYF